MSVAAPPLAAVIRGAVPAGAPTLIYAPGGGLGHVTRALALARALPGRVHVWHQAPAPPGDAPAHVRLWRPPARWGPARVEAALARAARATPLLVVDTFPAGLEGEVSPRALDRFARRVLVRRWVRPGAYPRYEARAARFDRALLPYPPDACEWDGAAPGLHVGHLLRTLPLAPSPADPRDLLDLVVLGDPGRLPPAWRARLPARTRAVSGWAPRLPRARRYLALGAGYHTAYELERLGLPRGLVPEERRYDDQFRRAARLGAGVHGRLDLARLLAAPAADEPGGAR